MEAHLKFIGLFLVALSLFHGIFPRYFNWKGELESLSLINRQIVYIHTLFIGLVLLLMGLLCMSCAHEMVSTQLGRYLSLGLGVFWLVRLFVQFFGFSSVLWKGKKFETTVHIVFALFWTYLSTVFLMVYVGY